MSFTISHLGHSYPYQETLVKSNPISNFFRWAKNQDKINHVTWIGISVTVMAGVLFPMAMTVILINGANFGLIMAAMVAMVLVVISNLAALPTTYTIPILILGALIDLIAIVLSFFI
ncbi:MAG: hypothetical protein C5B59_00235 [Bacteroidetes bacterium]|nr:MAG: hypothetical protein C5B59_00235 [Bacteroidota bacterium]